MRGEIALCLKKLVQQSQFNISICFATRLLADAELQSNVYDITVNTDNENDNVFWSLYQEVSREVTPE